MKLEILSIIGSALKRVTEVFAIAGEPRSGYKDGLVGVSSERVLAMRDSIRESVVTHTVDPVSLDEYEPGNTI